MSHSPKPSHETNPSLSSVRIKLWIGNLHPNVTSETLALFASTHLPSFLDAIVINDKVTRKSREYGFIYVSNIKDAMLALKSLNGKRFQGRSLKIKMADKKAKIGSRSMDKKIKKMVKQAKKEMWKKK
ncbi:RNA-binding protein [Aduncisulcus paluster]|uniref:RNA-binding protein n=1 Tax=Aduncisulcus paluster TaxID=2918883 RepID=A0ABQ5KRQ0_9EUKA|nr:RNA-binding protein [Aduncisulcus paluster]